MKISLRVGVVCAVWCCVEKKECEYKNENEKENMKRKEEEKVCVWV